MPMKIKYWNSFSVTNTSQNEAKLTYIRLNCQTPCPPRGAVPVNQGCSRRLFHSQHPDRLRSWLRPFQLCQTKDLANSEDCSSRKLVIPVNGIPFTAKRMVFCALLTVVLCVEPGISRARLYNVNTGRFQTMDTYQGNNEDPLSLHKYLYCQADPVNGVDPNGHITVKCLTPRPLITVTGSYEIDWQFTLDKVPPEDGYIVQEIPIKQDRKDGPFTKHYWEAWFIPGANGGSPPSVTDHWRMGPSIAEKGTGSEHSKIKYYFKRNTGDLGDYRTPPAKPDPKTGWQPGDGHNWSIDLPWTDDPKNVRPWWDGPSDNGETDAYVDLDTAWEVDPGSIPSVKFENIDVTPLSIFGE